MNNVVIYDAIQNSASKVVPIGNKVVFLFSIGIGVIVGVLLNKIIQKNVKTENKIIRIIISILIILGCAFLIYIINKDASKPHPIYIS